jgi:hypothetical protein
MGDVMGWLHGGGASTDYNNNASIGLLDFRKFSGANPAAGVARVFRGSGKAFFPATNTIWRSAWVAVLQSFRQNESGVAGFQVSSFD